MSKEKGVPFNLQVEEHLNPLAEGDEEGDEEAGFESIVEQANKKTKKKKKIVQHTKKVLKENAPEPKALAKGVKEQGKRVGKTAKENVTPENLGKVYNDPGEAINIVTDIITGKKLIPQSDKSKALEMTEKQKYDILVGHIKDLEGTVNRCCEDKKLRSNIQFVDAESLFNKNLEDIKAESKQKYDEVIDATVRQTKRTTHRTDRDLKETLMEVAPISDTIQRFVNPQENIRMFEILKSIILQYIRGEGEISELSQEQAMVVEDIRELIQYSNKHGDPHIKKGKSRTYKPPGLRISDIIRLIFGYYIYNPQTSQVEAHISKDLIEGQQFGDLRYDIIKQASFKNDFIQMFHQLYGIIKDSMKSTLTNYISKKEKVLEDVVVIQRLYDRGAKKKKKTFKKKKKKEKKTKMK